MNTKWNDKRCQKKTPFEMAVSRQKKKDRLNTTSKQLKIIDEEPDSKPQHS